MGNCLNRRNPDGPNDPNQFNAEFGIPNGTNGFPQFAIDDSGFGTGGKIHVKPPPPPPPKKGQILFF